jgi:hypothetical protein
MAPAGGQPVPALALLGIGSGTTVDTIQVHAALGDAVYVSGGYIDLRGIVVTAPGAAALSWNDGWHGRLQFLSAQLAGGAGVGIRGSNVSGGTMMGTRSDPRMSQVTIVGGPGSVAGIVLENGTAAEIANAIVVGVTGPGLEIQGAETCDQANGGGINVHHGIFFGNSPDLSGDADCVDEAAYATAPARANRLLDPQLTAPTSTATPDLRPAATSPAQIGYAMMPPDGFFDTSVQFVGAVGLASVTGSNIPWYVGWTRGWSGQP